MSFWHGLRRLLAELVRPAPRAVQLPERSSLTQMNEHPALMHVAETAGISRELLAEVVRLAHVGSRHERGLEKR